MPLFQTQFWRGPCDGLITGYPGHPPDGTHTYMEWDGSLKSAAIYVWSEKLGFWIFKEHVRKGDFMEVRK